MYKISLLLVIATNYLFGGFYDDDIYELKTFYDNKIEKNKNLTYNNNPYQLTQYPIYQLSEIEYDQGSDGIIDKIQSYTHDKIGNILSSVTSNIDFGESQYFSYDTNGNLLSTYRDTGYSHLDLHHFTYTNSYLTKDVHDYNGDGQFIETIIYTYLSNQIQINHYDSGYTTIEKYIYNTQGLAISKEYGSVYESYIYDTYGNLISVNNSYYPCNYTYNVNNQRTSSTCHIIANNKYSIEYYTYDSKGAMLSYSHEGPTFRFKRFFTYNNQGYLIKAQYDEGYNGSIDWNRIYTYDDNGHLIHLVESGLYGNATYNLKWINTEENYGWLSAIYNIILN
jgi:hypothetical protein